MYNSTFTCTYNFYDSSLALTNPCSKEFLEKTPDFHEEPESELLEMADFLYKNEVLSAFHMEEFDEKEFNSKVQELYVSLFFFNEDDKCEKSKGKMKNIMKKVSEKLLMEDEEFGFIILFSYSYFHLTHLCLCELFDKGEISDKLIDALNAII
jgi:hypothetical protein